MLPQGAVDTCFSVFCIYYVMVWAFLSHKVLLHFNISGHFTQVSRFKIVPYSVPNT
jgi:hypothetical protein